MFSSAFADLKLEECSSSGGGSSSMAVRPYRGRERSLFSLTSDRDDDEAQFDTSDTDNNHEVLMAGKRYPSIQEFALAIPNHLLLGSLLEHLCFVYESDPTRSRMLFKVIGQRLAAMNLLSPLAISDEFSTVRLQHNRAFTELLHAASSSLSPQSQQLLSAETQDLTARPKEGLFQAQTSRYLSEFEEICRLGKGSYGKVFKVKNKLDGQYYATKKILIKNVSKDDCMKVLREVKMLSSLQHINVVGYHTAWMEHVQPASRIGGSHSFLPALESPAPQLSSDESLDGSGGHSSSSSIVFQSSGRAVADPATDKAPPPGALAPPRPKNYVPCVFLGRPAPAERSSGCPALGWDDSVQVEVAGGRKPEPNNKTRMDFRSQQWGDKQTAKPFKEVQFHLTLYIQMQLCERSLKDWICERNARPQEELPSKCPYACVDVEHTLSLLRKTLEGVEYIHSRGIMHRDLKPRNIFLHGHDGQVRIGDFGLACKDMIVDDHEPLPSTTSDTGYAHTTGVGTLVYAAPEQLKGSHYDSKSDMYSLGVLALELFQPFGTEMERVLTLDDLRDGKVPESFCHRWPLLAQHVIQLTSQDPRVRPNATQVLQSELFHSKDMVILGLQQRVEEQEEELAQLRRQISHLQGSQKAGPLSDVT